MTTEPQTTSPASAREIFFQLAASDLPAPTDVMVATGNAVLSMTFATEEDLEAWADALNADRFATRSLSKDGKRYSWYYTYFGWLGRHGSLTYHEDVPVEALTAEPDWREDEGSEESEDNECPGHESLDGAHMGESVFCDGTCIQPGVTR